MHLQHIALAIALLAQTGAQPVAHAQNGRSDKVAGAARATGSKPSSKTQSLADKKNSSAARAQQTSSLKKPKASATSSGGTAPRVQVAKAALNKEPSAGTSKATAAAANQRAQQNRDEQKGKKRPAGSASSQTSRIQSASSSER